MKIDFSIVIPTYNGEKTINKLLTKISQFTDNYSKEIIVIDSQSTDQTLSIVKNYKEKLNLKIIKINKDDFNHGETRNMGVNMAQGKFIYFLSQDAIPIRKNILEYYKEDFKLDKKVVAIFGKHIPYDDTPIIQKLEVMCRWERLDRFTDKKGVLIQNINKPFIPFLKENLLDWYVLSNTSCCYKKSFLVKNSFPKLKYGEDLMLGKKIIDQGFSKIYDARCSVLHSHIFTLHQYYKREAEDLQLRLLNMRFKPKLNILCKIKKIVNLNCSLLKKINYMLQLFFYYFLKVLIIFSLKLKK